jgi:general secretion pathway protein I
LKIQNKLLQTVTSVNGTPVSVNQRGFTLIEVLVALGIVAITLIAGVQAMGSMTLNAQRQWDIFLAEQCANNALNSLRLSAQLPPVGEQSVNCVQANVAFSVRISINTTPNSTFRRVDAQVFKQDLPQLKITTVIGRI